MYKANILSKCLYSNACIILLVVGSIPFRKVDLRRTEQRKNVAALPVIIAVINTANCFGQTLKKIQRVSNSIKICFQNFKAAISAS